MEVCQALRGAKGNELRSNGGNDQVSELFGGIDPLPTAFLIDREGKIVSTHVGLVSKRDYEAEILKLIAQ